MKCKEFLEKKYTFDQIVDQIAEGLDDVGHNRYPRLNLNRELLLEMNVLGLDPSCDMEIDQVRATCFIAEVVDEILSREGVMERRKGEVLFEMDLSPLRVYADLRD